MDWIPALHSLYISNRNPLNCRGYRRCSISMYIQPSIIGSDWHCITLELEQCNFCRINIVWYSNKLKGRSEGGVYERGLDCLASIMSAWWHRRHCSNNVTCTPTSFYAACTQQTVTMYCNTVNMRSIFKKSCYYDTDNHSWGNCALSLLCR